MSKTHWVNMIFEIVDKSGMFKWTVQGEDDGAVAIECHDWDIDERVWKKSSGEITVYGTDKARKLALCITRLCDHIDLERTIREVG